MESSHSFNGKKNISNYVLIPFALVQSEIYWFCSVLYYIFKQSLDALEEQQRLEDKKRRRANSAPVRSLSAPTPNTEQQQSEEHQSQQLSVKFAKKHKIESYNANLPTKSLRRTSLPDINIRHRPSVHDERKGTTCPPLWWQKTRVKLGHTPVHGDPKPISTNVVLDNQQGLDSTLISSSSSIQVAVTPLPSPTSSSITASPVASARPSFEQDTTESSSSSIKSQESNTNKQRNDSNVSTSSKKGSKFISKISAAFHKRSKSRD